MATPTSHFHKTMPAYLAALGMSALIGLCILAFGASALLNRNTVPVQAAAPKDSLAAQAADTLTGQETVQQLQEQIKQFQGRETQFQSQIQQAADQINQLSQQVQQYQSLINSLQDAGVIQIAPDGRVLLGSASRRGGDDD